MILQIVFWILLLLCAIGCFVPADKWPLGTRGSGVIGIVLFAILGYKLFGNPLDK